MFTGIVDHCGKIQKIENKDSKFSLMVESKFSDIMLGESIAVDGVCLTVTGHQQNTFCLDLSPETLKLTIAGRYQVGDSVNLERPLRLSDRLGGHFVTGHVDCVAKLQAKKTYNEFIGMEFEITPEFSGYLVKKGSVAINGVSLTLNDVGPSSFNVMLIPHTLEVTNLSRLEKGDSVNIEFDYLAKLVQKQMRTERV